MVEVQIRRPVAPEDLALVRKLAAAAESVDGHAPIGEGVWHDLEAARDGTMLALAFDQGEEAGALPVTAHDSRHLTAAVVVAPAHRESGVASALLGAAVADIAGRGGGHLSLWAFAADGRAEAFATAEGLTPERELWQMRVPLPLDERPRWPAGVELRTFVVGQDEREWLDVNNRAFEADPDQRGWTLADLEVREREPWFDPLGFLLAVEDGRIAGFCWTKVHPAAPPHEPEPLGEIYVIGVDPDRQGGGLGRALVVAGLESLHDRGVSVGMLFVDATNAPATRLYDALGFRVARIDRSFGRDVP